VIFLVRHGEAAASWGDHPDPGLSTLGRDQAERAALELQRRGAVQAVTSPMQRCRETAAAFEALTGVTATVETRVSEIETPKEIDDRVAWLRDVMAGEWPEELLDWRRQAHDAVSALPDGTVVFSHFVAINAIVGDVMNDPRVLVFRPGHCSITQLARGEGGLLTVSGLGVEAETRVL